MKEEISLVKIFEIILKLWWVVLIFALIFSVAAYSLSVFVMTPQYTSTSKVYVSAPKRNETITINDLNISQRLVSTYIEILCGNQFLDEVAESYNKKHPDSDEISGAMIKNGIVMSSANDTEVLVIKYTDNTPKRAQEILTELILKAPEKIKIVDENCKFEEVDTPSLPTGQSAPDVKQNTFIGLFLGIIMGVAVIFIRELLDTRIKDDEELKTRYQIPVLGIIPNLEVE